MSRFLEEAQVVHSHGRRRQLFENEIVLPPHDLKLERAEVGSANVDAPLDLLFGTDQRREAGDFGVGVWHRTLAPSCLVSGHVSNDLSISLEKASARGAGCLAIGGDHADLTRLDGGAMTPKRTAQRLIQAS
jgi:hypothetical protein